MALERRWWGIAALPTRAVTDASSRRVPHDADAGIRLAVADAWLAPEADRLFAAGTEALAVAAAGGPSAGVADGTDVRRIACQPGACALGG